MMNIKNKKSILCAFLMTLSSTLYAGQNDYDGTWNVDISCSINSNNQMPGFSYSEIWSIKNDAISHTSNKKTKQGDEQTVWSGKISNKILTINAEGDNGNSQRPWLWTGSGAITGDDLFQVNADMIGRIGRKVRDCTLRFSSLDPAVGSLAYLKTHPVSTAKAAPLKAMGPQEKSKPEPAKVAESRSELTSSVAGLTPKNSTESLKTAVEPKSSESNNSGTPMYLLIGGILILIGGFILSFLRMGKNKSSLTNSELLTKQKNKADEKEITLTQKAKELEQEQLQLKEAQRDLKEKELLAAKNAKALIDSAEAEAIALRKKAEEELEVIKRRAEEELASARAIKEAVVLKREAEEELAKATAIRKTLEAEAKLSIEKQRAQEELVKSEELKKAAEGAARLAAEKQRAEEVLARAQALKDAEERKRKADEEFERLKGLSESDFIAPKLDVCKSCGTQLRVGAKFCQKCGSKVA